MLKLRRAHPVTVLAAVIFAATVSVGISGCTPIDSSADSVITDDSSDAAAWSQAFEECMADEGVDFNNFDVTDGEAGELAEGAIDLEQLEVAQKVCSEKVGEPPIDPNGPSTEEMNEQMFVFAKCMRDAGYDFPDPSADAARGGISVQEFSGEDIDEADFTRCDQVAGLDSADIDSGDDE